MHFFTVQRMVAQPIDTNDHPGGFINSIAIHPSNPDKIAVALSGPIGLKYRRWWSNVAGLCLNLPNFSALAVVWHDNGDDGLYLGMDYGVYYIDNTFSDWQPFYNQSSKCDCQWIGN